MAYHIPDDIKANPKNIWMTIHNPCIVTDQSDRKLKVTSKIGGKVGTLLISLAKSISTILSFSGNSNFEKIRPKNMGPGSSWSREKKWVSLVENFWYSFLWVVVVEQNCFL